MGAHLAEGLRTSSVVIFDDTQLHRWGPLSRDRHRPVIGVSSPVETVLAEARNLLAAKKKATADLVHVA